jgi:hypothetical protein
LSLSSIANNLTIFITTLVVLILTFIGLAWFVQVDFKEIETKEVKRIKSAYKFSSFLSLSAPAEFQDTPW